ncbi:MAG: RNA repair domain-containing protein [Candidatus Hadarchaeales archaeon]
MRSHLRLRENQRKIQDLKPKEVLDKLKWAEGKLGSARILIVHRGAPGNVREIRGSDIVSMNRSFMYVRSAPEPVAIPYHRIVKIEVDGECVWKKTSA